jgi:hypothetical protein
MNDEDITLKPFIEPRFDDPFIILRKDNVKKSIELQLYRQQKHQN